MKPRLKHIGLSLLAGTAVLVWVLVTTTSYAQTDSGFYRPLTLAPADAPSSGGGGAGLGGGAAGGGGAF